MPLYHKIQCRHSGIFQSQCINAYKSSCGTSTPCTCCCTSSHGIGAMGAADVGKKICKVWPATFALPPRHHSPLAPSWIRWQEVSFSYSDTASLGVCLLGSSVLWRVGGNPRAAPEPQIRHSPITVFLQLLPADNQRQRGSCCLLARGFWSKTLKLFG